MRPRLFLLFMRADRLGSEGMTFCANSSIERCPLWFVIPIVGHRQQRAKAARLIIQRLQLARDRVTSPMMHNSFSAYSRVTPHPACLDRASSRRSFSTG